MRQVATALIAITCIFVLVLNDAEGQGPGAASIGFNNRTDVNVIVIGYTVVNGSKKGGPALQLKKSGGKAFESNVPTGAIRYYTIHDANQPGTILGRAQLPIARDGIFDIVPTPGNAKVLMIVPAMMTP
jgi:hypothetical protein